MKEFKKGMISGALISATILGLIGTAAATIGSQMIQAEYSNIKVTLDGKEINLVDSNGDSVEPFSVHGTTYLPVRAVANALGLDVEWSQEDGTVNLFTKRESASTYNEPEIQGGYEITYQNLRIYGKSGDKYSVIAEVHNTGSSNLYLRNATFDIEDSYGMIQETITLVSMDPDVIAPGEKGYLYSSGTLLNVRESEENVLVTHANLEVAESTPIKHTISHDFLKGTPSGGAKVTGRITNDSGYADTLSGVCCVLFREDGTPITAKRVKIPNVYSGDTAGFIIEFSSDDLGVNPSEIATYQIFSFDRRHQYQPVI